MSLPRTVSAHALVASACALTLANVANATTTRYAITELLPVETPGFTTAHGINAGGLNPGVVTDGNNPDPAALFNTSGSPTLLPTPDGAAGGYGQALNDAGTVVGGAVFFRRPQAVVWSGGAATLVPLSDGDADDTDELFASYGRGINNAGVVVGDAET